LDIKLNAFKIIQNKIDIYITIMKASDLKENCEIDWWTERKENGYQRPLDQNRLSKALKYLIHEEGLYPTSILANIRGFVDYSPAFSIDENNSYGVLKIPEDSLPIWIIDGQHRLYSIYLASRENMQFENYTLPITLLNLKNKYEEMRQFYIINSRQKKVRTDLAQRHLFKSLDINQLNITEFESRDKILAAKALPLVDFLRLHPESVWYNKIQIPSELKKIKSQIISQTSMANSLVFLLKNLTNDEVEEICENPKNIGILLVKYWNVLKDIYKQAFEDPNEYTIQKTTGCYVFNMLFYNIYQNCIQNQNCSFEYIKIIVQNALKIAEKEEKVPFTSSTFWNVKTGHYFASSSGMKNIRGLYLKLSQVFDEEVL
jgi:DGQHR domain-containing protein